MIAFAVEQAKAAEAFGFTRNEACRNLKTALYQYWQNKTLGLHGQAQKSKMLRSLAAVGLPLSECTVEHAVPLMTIVNLLMKLAPLTEEAVTDLLTSYYLVRLVTKAEHAKLNASGLCSTMPKDWDGIDVFARYAAVGIQLCPEPSGATSSLVARSASVGPQAGPRPCP